MSEKKKHYVIIIPGLGDDRPLAKLLTRVLTYHWRYAGLTVWIHSVHWLNNEPFAPKLQKTLELIDSLSKKGTVSVVGMSAGGSMALNVFAKRKSVIHRAINVCGRLKEGDYEVRSLDKMAKTSKSFKHSVLKFEATEPSLTHKDRNRIMTIQTFLGDELVPPATSQVRGAVNKWIYIPEHMLSIGFSLLLYKPLISFMRETNT